MTARVVWSDAYGGWLVQTRALALAVMRDAAGFTVDDPRFSTARVVGPSMLSTEGAAHDRHRAPFAAPFRLRAIRGDLRPIVAGEAGRLVDAFAGAGAAELRTQFAGPLAAAVMAHILQIADTPTADVLRWYAAIVRATTDASEGRPPDPAGTAAFAELVAAIGPALAAAGDLGRDEIVSNAAVLLFGGIETTEGMICNAVWHLLTHPDALARVRADPGLLAAALEESLRLEPAAAVIDRYATADTELGGIAVARGDKVAVSIAAANRDPAVFADPGRFDLDRPNRARHITFAAGPHVCLGMHLARLEAHTALRVLLERLPGLALAQPTAPEGLVFRKPPVLRVRWTG